MRVLKEKLIDYAVLKKFDIDLFIRKNPFPYGEINGLLLKDKFEKLREELPHKKLFSEQKGNHRRYGQKSHDRLSLDFNSATPVSKTWKNLVDEIETGKYREFINRVLGTDKFHFKYHWHYTESAASVSPHCDAEWKLGSHIFYFNSHQNWDPIWGGQTVILDDNGEKNFRSAPDFNDFKRQIEIPCIGNHSLLFKRTNHSWHGVRRINCPENKLRRVFIIEFRQNKISNIIRNWINR